MATTGKLSGTHSLTSADLKLLGERPGDFAGFSVGAAGDVNGDRVCDLMVSAWMHDSAATTDRAVQSTCASASAAIHGWGSFTRPARRAPC